MTHYQTKFNEFVNYIESIGFCSKSRVDDLFGVPNTVEYFIKFVTEETYFVMFFDGEYIRFNFGYKNEIAIFLADQIESVENLSKLIETVECNLFSFVSILLIAKAYAVVLDDLLTKSTCCKIEIGTSDLSSDYVYLDLNEDGGRLYSKIKK